MNTKPDRRVERTRQALRAALIGLILDKGYEAISVMDIAERANVGRSTFYMHYSTKDAVFSDSFRALEVSLRAVMARQGAGGGRSYTGVLFSHVDANRQLYRALAGQRGGVLATGHIRRILLDLVRRDIESQPPGSAASKAARDGAVHYVVGAITGVLSWWLDHKTGWSSDQLDRFVTAMITPGLLATLRENAGEV